MRAGVRVLNHPQGVRLDGHLLRGGAATRTVDHCTSPPFVPGNRTRCARASARAVSRASGRGAGRPRRSRAPVRRAPRAPCRGSGRCRAAWLGGRSTDDVGREPDVVDPALVGRQPARDRELERAALARQLLPLLDGALAERLSGRRASPARGPGARRRRSRSPRRCRRRSGTTSSIVGIGRDAAAAARRSRPGRRSRPAPRRSAPSAMNWLAIVARRGDVAARVAAQVEDQLRPPGVEVRRERVLELVGRGVGEAGQPDVADRRRRRGPRSRPRAAG